MEPHISVIIPAYNLEDYIGESIESVLKQEKFHDYEILVIDDNSSDSTKNIIHSYTQKDPRIKLLINEFTKGAGGSRNTGLKHARGEWIAFLDGDDWWSHECLYERLLSIRENPEIKIIASNFYDYNPYREKQFCKISDIKKSWNFIYNNALKTNSNTFIKDPFKYIFLDDSSAIHTCTVMIKKEIIDNVGYFNQELKLAEDIDYWARILLVTNEYFFISKPLAYVRTRSGSLTRSGEPGSLYLIKVLENLTKERQLQNYRQYLKKAIISNYLSNIYYYKKNLNFEKSKNESLKLIKNYPFSIRGWKSFFITLIQGIVSKINR